MTSQTIRCPVCQSTDWIAVTANLVRCETCGTSDSFAAFGHSPTLAAEPVHGTLDTAKKLAQAFGQVVIPRVTNEKVIEVAKACYESQVDDRYFKWDTLPDEQRMLFINATIFAFKCIGAI